MYFLWNCHQMNITGSTDDKWTLVQVMAWCRQATNHYLSQCWPISMLPYGVIRPQWVNFLIEIWGCLNIKMLYQYRDSHYKDLTISDLSHLYNVNPHTWKDHLYIETRPRFSCLAFFSIAGSGLFLNNYPDITVVPFLAFTDQSDMTPSYQGFIRFWTYVILFQVPIRHELSQGYPGDLILWPLGDLNEILDK